MRDPGESLFEKFCAETGLKYERVQEAAGLGERRPDYRVDGRDGTLFWAEVKALMPNEREADELRRKKAGEVVVHGGTPGERLRRLIGKANPQLRALANDGAPGVLFVFNDEPHLSWHVDPYSVLTAMRGLDVVDVFVPRDPRESPRFGELRSGPGKKMTEHANTSTSALVCVELWRGTETAVNVFHNRHASIPLPVSVLAGPPFRQWCMADDERDWESLDAG
jgi:hypothetical protein